MVLCARIAGGEIGRRRDGTARIRWRCVGGGVLVERPGACGVAGGGTPCGVPVGCVCGDAGGEGGDVLTDVDALC